MHLRQDSALWTKFHPQGPQWWASDEATTAVLKVPFFLDCSPLTAGAALLVAAISFSVTIAPCKIKPTLRKYCRPPVLVHQQFISSLGTLTHLEWEKQRVLCSIMNQIMMAPAATSFYMASGRSGTLCFNRLSMEKHRKMGWRDKHFLCASSSIGFYSFLRRNESTKDHTMKMQKAWGKTNLWKGVY